MITSVQNPTVKAVTKLHQKKYRDETLTFLVMGVHEITEALKTYEPVQLFSLDESFNPVSPHVMKKMAGGNTPNQLGVFKKRSLGPLGEKVLVLENIQDPGNVGTLIRSAAAFGFKDVLTTGGVDLYHPKVVSSTEGYFFHLNVGMLPFKGLMDALKDYHHIKTTVSETEDASLKKPFALWLGNEGQGLSEEALKLNGSSWHIKTQTVESLNVAVAGSIIMHALKDF